MTRQNRTDTDPQIDAEQGGQGGQEKKRRTDWADEAAKARTGDDPRAVAPHDRLGTPSTGDTR